MSGAPAAGEARPRSPASNFFAAFRFLPAERRRAIETVYDFCRRADDAVDEASDPAAARASLAALEVELNRAFQGGGAGRSPSSLAGVVARFRLPREPFDLLLEGMHWDLEGRRYATRAELREYCRRVASSVGVLCVRIFGCADPACDRYAEELGIALQWTNILRDLGSDLERGRLYLPEESLRRHSLAPEDLVRDAAPAAAQVAALVRAEAAYARACFREAERLLPAAERHRVLAGRIMGAIYEALLAKVERAGARVLERRVALSRAGRALVALRVFLSDRIAWSAGASS